MVRRQFLIVLSTLALSLPVRAQTPAPASPRSASVEEAFDRAKAGKMIIIDLRTPQEWAETGVPSGAKRMDMSDSKFIEEFMELKEANPGKEIGLICRSGNRSTAAQKVLVEMGYDDIVNIRGGVVGTWREKGWLGANLPVTKP